MLEVDPTRWSTLPMAAQQPWEVAETGGCSFPFAANGAIGLLN